MKNLFSLRGGIFWLSLGFTCFFLMGISEFTEMRELVTTGTTVAVESLGVTKVRWGREPAYQLRFRYAGQIRTVKTKVKPLTNARGQTYLLHLAKYPRLFLPASYNFNAQFISFLLVSCLFIATTAIAFYKTIHS